MKSANLQSSTDPFVKKNSSGSAHSYLFSMLLHLKQSGLFGPFCVDEILLNVRFFYQQQLIFMKLNTCSQC